MASSLPERIAEAARSITGRCALKPKAGVILGTGLHSLSRAMQVEAEIPFASIPHFAAATAEGHAGTLLLGKLDGKPAALLHGRFHFYEGHTLDQVTFPVRVLKALGCETLAVTNIAGGLNPQFKNGDLMVITDHINLMGVNPLVGKNYEELGPRFPDMSQPYARDLLELAAACALELKIPLHRGVYSAMTGPCLETAAEYRMLRILGADAIGMSTVPEVIVAVHAGLKVLGLTLISDLCLPDALKPVSLPELFAVVAEAEPKMAELLREFLRRLP